jgi:arylformamidase
MTLYDISLTLTEDLPTWPGDPPLQLTKISSIAAGEMANVTHISAAVHVGTHVDAPDHFLDNGSAVDQIPLDLLVGQAVVAAVSGEEVIRADDLRKAGVTGKHQRVLIKTRNSNYWSSEVTSFQEDFLALDRDAAEELWEISLELGGLT